LKKVKTKKKPNISKDTSRKIVVFDVQLVTPVDSERVSEAGMGQKLLNAIGIKSTSLDSDYIQNKVTEFVSSMHEIISKSAAESREFKVDTVEVNAEISAEGQIGLMGTHAGMKGTTGIKFVFKRA
jgi:hypothetical protein